MKRPPRVLSIFSLVMINVIAVDSLRTLPISAELGFSLIFFYVLAAFAFFIPIGLVAAELATAYPKTGGLYVWVREAFGLRAGFITIWLQWIYNVVWYPTIMAFIAVTIAYLIDPALASNKLYLLTTVLSLFWLYTLLNCFGMRISSIISTIGALIGTLLPMLGIILLGVIWLIQERPIAAASGMHLLPDMSMFRNLALFSVVLFGLIGLEMSAVHAEEVENPQQDYPIAIAWSTLIIFATLVFSSLAIVIVVPQNQLNLVSGLISAFDAFFQAFGIPGMTQVLATLIIIGALSCVAAWIIGPAKGLLISAQDGALPKRLAKVNRFGVPVRLLVLQAVIVTLLSSLFILLDSVSEAYWLLSALSAQMALLVYIFMFAAAIKLRYQDPNRIRSYRIPGGNIVMWLISGTGIFCCFTALLTGFVPPAQIAVTNLLLYEAFLVGGLILFFIIPWHLARKHRGHGYKKNRV